VQRLIIDSLGDQRIAHYRSLKHPNRLIRKSLFIVEGEKLAGRLLKSDYEVESILLSDRYDPQGRIGIPEHIPVYIVDHELIEEMIGFPFHRGVLACGWRKPLPSLREIVATLGTSWTAVVCPVVHDPENIGQILRLSAAFGVDFVLVGPSCPDLFSRRVLRVSMGSVLSQRVIQSRDLHADLCWLREQVDFEGVATVLDDAAESLEESRRAKRTALFFGTEGEGLEDEWLGYCSRRVTIPMQAGTDSLNVASAAAIFLYHYTRR
jgi:tRNA G18 (ribose-2'-O)-methylase SpoU